MSLKLWSALTFNTGVKVASSGCLITFVGAGGKTSSISCLARELKEKRLLITTTTHFFRFAGFAHTEFLADEKEQMMDRLAAIWEDSPGETVVVGSRIAAKIGSRYKVKGIPADWVDLVKESFPGLVILVEGDGSAGKPVKAPAGYEPVVPAATDIIVPVLGMSGLGANIDSKNVHRLEQVKALAGRGKIISKELFASILIDDAGYGRLRDEDSLYIPLLNQVDPSNISDATRIAQRLVARGIDRVILAAVQDDKPVKKIVI
ncbi:MAG: selenium cofactor biosynthesis protein YqeC [Halanaerobium sp.]|nr:selenium cofactor biosynthesis protein YqeC [Halanaerobium sp.]